MSGVAPRPPRAAEVMPPVPYGARLRDAKTGETVRVVRPSLRRGSDRVRWAQTFADGWSLVEFAHGGRLCVHVSNFVSAEALNASVMQEG